MACIITTPKLRERNLHFTNGDRLCKCDGVVVVVVAVVLVAVPANAVS
jgi:hypothetical protein